MQTSPFLDGLTAGLYGNPENIPADAKNRQAYRDGYRKGTALRAEHLAERGAAHFMDFVEGVIDGWLLADTVITGGASRDDWTRENSRPRERQ